MSTAPDAPSSPPSAGAPDPEPGAHLAGGLRTRHLTMMGLGSAIGAGLFLGTGAGINLAGPAVLVSYAAAGLLVILVMRMLAEMAAARPESGSFSVYAELGIGRWAGFTVGWMYWFTLIMVLGAEITGASVIVHGWLPGVPQWTIALVLVAVLGAVNLVGVRSFGEFEFWFAAIKVAAILAFLVIGVLLVAGWLPGTEPIGLGNLTEHGGFLPNGFDGVASGLLVVVFAFGGIEIITIAAAEARDPAASIARAARSIVWRILFFYIGAVAIMVLVLPWDSPALATGPFVAVLEVADVPGTALLMEAVVVVALLSAFNANVYGTSRMAYSLSLRDDGPRALRHVSASGVPSHAVWVSVFFGIVSVVLNWALPDDLLGILLNAVGASLLVVWVFAAVSQLRLRRRFEADGTLSVRMWGFPYLTWLALAAIAGVVVLMLLDDDARGQVVFNVALAALLGGGYLLAARLRRPAETVVSRGSGA